ncbi:hypothetical protein [Leisingera methylohalidivorans]|uniref:Uncharacterized protein n=1 Tax=Leisingera methylohalidivorans DSM 14336 TaxID=999552 RepID=V9VWC3_9RHOB|nr:hypothetical protein [Leisingera methylohalidivorans]AHD03071.1 hypothetical protein METH_10625 [Leisingera methylohalidivorans DSM 14336]
MVVSSRRLMAQTVNVYAEEISVADAVEGGPIVVFWRYGAEMLRQGGGIR